jgi:hypothetical protein
VIYRGAWRDSLTGSRVLADTALIVEVAAVDGGGLAHLILVKPQSPPRNRVGELWLDQPFRMFPIESR